MMSKLVKVCLIIVLLVSPGQGAEDPAISLTRQVRDEVLSLLRNKSNSLAQRRQAIKDIMEKYFNMDEIGKFVLGIHWKKATPQQQKEFLRLFRDVLADNYASQFNNYGNEEVIIQRSKPGSGGGILVIGQIKRPTGQPVEIAWLLRKKDGKLRIFDVIVEGASMSQTLRSEYATRFTKSGNTIEGLLSTMQAELN